MEVNDIKDLLIRKDLHDRELKVIKFIKENGSITNKEYRKIFAISRETASRDLRKLKEMGILINSGAKGVGSIYTLK